MLAAVGQRFKTSLRDRGGDHGAAHAHFRGAGTGSQHLSTTGRYVQRAVGPAVATHGIGFCRTKFGL